MVEGLGEKDALFWISFLLCQPLHPVLYRPLSVSCNTTQACKVEDSEVKGQVAPSCDGFVLHK